MLNHGSIPEGDPQSKRLCCAFLFCPRVRPGHSPPMDRVNSAAVYIPVKSEPLERDTIQAFFAVEFRFAVHSLEHKCKDRIKAVASI